MWTDTVQYSLMWVVIEQLSKCLEDLKTSKDDLAQSQAERLNACSDLRTEADTLQKSLDQLKHDYDIASDEVCDHSFKLFLSLVITVTERHHLILWFYHLW